MVALVGQWWLDTRSPGKHEVAAHLVNLAYNGLAHLEPHPDLVDGPAGARAPSARLSQPRAGHGPCTARTVRNTPAPASSAASRTAAVSSAASAATVGPGAAHQRRQGAGVGRRAQRPAAARAAAPGRAPAGRW